MWRNDGLDIFTVLRSTEKILENQFHSLRRFNRLTTNAAIATIIFWLNGCKSFNKVDGQRK